MSPPCPTRGLSGLRLLETTWSPAHATGVCGWAPLKKGAEQVLPLTGVARESSAQRTRATAVMRGGDTGRLTSEPLETTCTAFNAVKVASLLTSVVVITVPNTA